jgi:hypothetical protein
MEQVLSFAGLAEAWMSTLEAYGVASLQDLLYMQPASLVLLGMTLGEARQLLTVAWSVHAAGGIDRYEEMLLAAGSAEAAARDVLQTVMAALDEGAVRGFFGHAQTLLASGEPRAAALALTAVERALASCKDSALRKVLCPAVHAVTDALIWRVQLRAPFGHRDAFLYELEMAHAQPLEDTKRSKLLLGHYKAVAARFPCAFLSQAKLDAARSAGGRCRKAKAKKATAQAGAQTDDA